MPLYTSSIFWSELAQGAASPAIGNELLRDNSIIEIDEDVAWHTSRVERLLKAAGRHSGDNDCRIAGTGLSEGLALVTRDARHVTRVSGLACASY